MSRVIFDDEKVFGLKGFRDHLCGTPGVSIPNNQTFKDQIETKVYTGASYYDPEQHGLRNAASLSPVGPGLFGTSYALFFDGDYVYFPGDVGTLITTP